MHGRSPSLSCSSGSGGAEPPLLAVDDDTGSVTEPPAGSAVLPALAGPGRQLTNAANASGQALTTLWSLASCPPAHDVGFRRCGCQRSLGEFASLHDGVH